MNKTLARDIMQSQVLSISKEAAIPELANLLVENNISGVPVVDENGAPIGVVSVKDVLAHTQEHDHGLLVEHDYYRLLEIQELHVGHGFQVNEIDDTQVKEIMSNRVVCVDEDSSVRFMAKVMSRERIHRLVVTRHGKLVGIVTSSDILEVVAKDAAA